MTIWACALLMASGAADLAQVSEANLRATVEKLASFHTRNTLSEGHREAAAWVAEKFREIPGVEVELMTYRAEGRRIPEPFDAVQVVATVKGTSDRTILLGAHLDSLNLQVDAKTGRAPGANDDASGVAMLLEVCRLVAGKPWSQTIKFAAFTGEEQGLLGSTALAKRAKAEGWKLDAMLNSDMIGVSKNFNGQSEPNRVRIFSEDGEGHQSRELARWLEFAIREAMGPDFGVKLVYRRDRFGRGGDHTPFVLEGFSAVRFCEVFEETQAQHNAIDLVEHMDFAYLAKNARANLASVNALATAADPPQNVRLVARQGYHTTVRWQAKEGVRYAVLWRDTASPVWQGRQEVGAVATATIQNVNIDDHLFAVQAIGGIPVVAR